MNQITDLARLERALERPLTETAELREQTAAAQWLDDAWGIIQDEIPGAAHRLAIPDGEPGALRQETVARVMVAMVVRVLRNPDARRQLGEDTYQETVDQAISSGQLYISDAERRRMLASADQGIDSYLPAVHSVPLS